MKIPSIAFHYKPNQHPPLRFGGQIPPDGDEWLAKDYRTRAQRLLDERYAQKGTGAKMLESFGAQALAMLWFKPRISLAKAGLRMLKKDYAGAEKHYKEALAMYESRKLIDANEMFVLLMELSEACALQGKDEEARQLRSRARIYRLG